MQSSSSRRSLLNYIGIGILMVGMGTGEFTYWRSLHVPNRINDDDLILTPETSRLYERSVETNVGTLGLIMVQCSRALGKLQEPRPLAITVCLFSALAAGGCFLVAARMPQD